MSWTCPRRTTLLLLFTLAAACGSARRGEPIIGEKRVPDGTIAVGQQVFDRNCAQCHPGGERGLGVALNDKPLPAWYIRFQIRNGLGAMPSFSSEQINGGALKAVARYVVWLRDQGD